MKLAVCGKGGVGKTTFSGMLMTLFVSEGYKVVGIDADPDPHLPSVFGIPVGEITPITEIKELIEQRIGEGGGFIRLNPEIADIPEKYGLEFKGVKLLVLGSKRGGDGCYCRENVLVKRLLEHLLTQDKEVVIIDMAAGIEHLTRGTSQLVDALLIIVEPDSGSIETAKKIEKLAKDLDIRNIYVIANKIETQEEKEFISSGLKNFLIIGFIPFDSQIKKSALTGMLPVSFESDMKKAIKSIKDGLGQHLTQKEK
ncbi:MAG: AAA family ATPase [Candidatus Omnitrophica bacterium]|nr:AAA family ATPase [Candidatus Omnitrophota bacterium]